MIKAYKVGANSGWGEEWLNTARKIGEDFFGLPQTEGTIATEVLESLFKDYTWDRMAKLKGTPSDKDLDLVELAGATMNRSRAANMIIIEFDAELKENLENIGWNGTFKNAQIDTYGRVYL